MAGFSIRAEGADPANTSYQAQSQVHRDLTKCLNSLGNPRVVRCLNINVDIDPDAYHCEYTTDF